MKKIISKILVLVIITSTINVGCKKHDTPPSLPPEASFVMDFDSFNNGENNSSNKKMAADSTSNNHLNAGVHVLVWNLILTVNLAVPVASFVEAFNHEAEWDNGVDAYVWSYEFQGGNKTYTARLEGKASGESNVEWKMYISQSGGFQDVLWYSGKTANDGSSARWTISKDGNNPVQYLQIDYSKTDSEQWIKYTHIENVANNGGYIRFEKNEMQPYNRKYDIWEAANDKLVNIEWNSTTREGRIKNEKYFEDTDWHCWNDSLVDIVCP